MSIPESTYTFEICRTCESTSNLRPIDSNTSKLLLSYCGIRPLEEMTSICSFCSTRINEFENFRMAAQTVDAKLQGILNVLRQQAEKVELKAEEELKKDATGGTLSSDTNEQIDAIDIEKLLKLKSGNKEKKKKSISCEICGRSASSAKGLKRHHLLVHAEKKFPCLLCTKAYPSQKQLDSHMNVHTRKELYICDFCQGVFVNIKYIREHMPSQ